MSRTSLNPLAFVFVLIFGISCSEASGGYSRYGSTYRRQDQPDSQEQRQGDLENKGSSGYSRSGSTYRRQDQPDSQEQRVANLEDMVSMLKMDVAALREDADCPLAAFTAFFGPRSGTVAAGDPILFPLVANYGNVYDTATGVFTAPVDGIYDVGVSIRPFDVNATSEFASVTIIKADFNGAPLPIGRVTSSNAASSFDVSSTDSVFYLEAGCEVFIRNDVTASFGAESSFRGFLIKEVTIDPDE